MDYLQLDFDKTCHVLATGPKLSIDEINRKRNEIIERLNTMVKTEIKLDNFERIMTPKVLESMITMYDELFFDNNIRKLFEKHGCVISVCFNNRCSKVAGMCYYKKRCKHMEIKLSSKVFKNALSNRKIKVRVNSGLECNNLLKCMLITFEHEFIHGLIGCFCYQFGHSNTYFREFYNEADSKHLFKGDTKPKNGHSSVFMTIVNKKFGHTKYLHDLLKHDSTQLIDDPIFEFFLKNEKEFNEYKKTLKIGDEIYFNNQNSVPQKCFVFSKLKNKVKCKIADNSNTIWTIPYQFIIRKKKAKTPTPTPPKAKTPTPTPPKAKTPTPTPPKAKTHKVKFVVKNKTKKVSVISVNSNNSNNNKPIQFTKKNSVIVNSNSNNNKPIQFTKKNSVIVNSNSNNNKPIQIITKPKILSKKKLENKTKNVVFDGPHDNMYLAGLLKDYTKTFGKGKVKDMDEIKRRCIALGKECAGFTLKNTNFSPRKGKVLKPSPSGEKSWLKK